MKNLGVLIWFIVLLPIITIGQKRISLEIIPLDQHFLPKGVKQNQSFPSIYTLNKNLRSTVSELNKQGYLSASIDSLKGDSLNKKAYLFIGYKFEWVKLRTDSVDEELLSRTGFRDKLFLEKPFNPDEIGRFFEKSLTYLENTGYPFAEIKLDDIKLDSNQIEASVVIQKNQFYTIDTIEVIGEPLRLNQNYIQNIIRIKPHQAYDERTISGIGNRIRENPFMEELLPYEVIFTESTCKIVLALKPKKASEFNGIIGLQPQPDNEKLIFTGDIKVSIGNIVGQGERLNLRWQRLKDQTQEINTSIDIPFLFKTPLGFGYELDIFRKDTSYNNVEQQFRIPFHLFNGSTFTGYYKSFRTNLISTAQYEGDTTLPDFNDARNNTYGIHYEAFFMENRFNPYKGWSISIKGGGGKNDIIPNPNLDQVNYDSVSLTSTLIEGEILTQLFQPISKQTTLLFQLRGALIQSENLVENQLYRIGGLHTIRGFDEQSIFASSYAIGTLEYRILLDEFSRLYVFTDLGWYEMSQVNNYATNNLYGIGAGISFQTNVGMFSLNYALGGDSKNTINFRTGKIHFGFVNFF